MQSKLDETKPIAVTATLRNWKIFTNYEGRTLATGDCFNDIIGRFNDGESIYTNTIIDGPTPLGYILTASGSVYYLDPNSKLPDSNNAKT